MKEMKIIDEGEEHDCSMTKLFTKGNVFFFSTLTLQRYMGFGGREARLPLSSQGANHICSSVALLVSSCSSAFTPYIGDM